MNNKGKSVVGLTLAVIMIASIFAMMAPISAEDPISADDVGISQVGISLEKDTIPSGASYMIGETIDYIMKVSNPTARTCTVEVYDEYPNGTSVTLDPSLTLDPGDLATYYGSYVVRAEDVDASGFVWNTLGVDGWNNATPPEPIKGEIAKASPITIPCEFDFTFEPVCCKLMNFTGTSGGPILNHSWDFGDGATPATLEDISGAPDGKPAITVAYSTCGTKTVTLSGYCDPGGYNATSKSVYVPCAPTAVATASNYSVVSGAGTVVEFDGCASYVDPEAAAKYPGWGIKGYKWTFDDKPGEEFYTCSVSRVVDGDPGDVICATLEVTDGHCNATAEVCVYVKTIVHQRLRLYGTFDEGPGNHSAIDPETGKKPENPPYTDPIAPFYPEAEQAPRKDFVTFNPAIMNHNEGYSELSFTLCGNGLDVQEEKEKVFKRMWYEKEWFKDHDQDGCWDVVIEKPDGTYVKTLPIENMEAIHAELAKGNRIREWNNDPTLNQSNVDIYGPAIKQEFAYMFLNDTTMPIMIKNGSRVLIPMAHDPANLYRGLNSFDADLDGVRDYVKVESEATLGLDIDHDGKLEPMDMDNIELNGNESVVLVLPEKTLKAGGELQFFDHKVMLKEVFGPYPSTATFLVSDNEGGGSTRSTEVNLGIGGVAYFSRGELTAPQTFYLRVVAIDWPVSGEPKARIEVGRMFGQTHANIGANLYWNQKAFIVDEVFYNVVAIKAENKCIKYIVFREKLPKMPIKLYGKHLKVWAPGEILPEMPPFNMPHEVIVDVQTMWTKPYSQQDKIGDKEPRPPLEISYTKEGEEMRYKGELKEIYNETDEEEFWTLEWFHTQPQQFTEFELPPDDKYLVTLSWRAYEAETTIWNDDPAGPLEVKEGDRVKFWYKVCKGPLYIDKETSSIRVFGTFDEGPGNLTVTDPVTGKKPENPPYTDPIAPFYPQAEQAPRKDFVTFNPAIMNHNEGYTELSFTFCDDGLDVQQEKEKVFKRMWYEKEWFKDHDKDGCWDVVIDKFNPITGKYEYNRTMCLDEWNSIPDWIKVRDKLMIREWNNDPTLNQSNVDLYGPVIKQEFTYMFLDDETMPIMIQNGSRVLIPLAHDPANPYRGLNSFDADLDGVRDYVKVESEATLGLDIDHDGTKEKMDMDGIELNGNESVVLVLPEKTLKAGGWLQFFDHKVMLKEVFGPYPSTATFVVSDNEGGGSTRSTEVNLGLGQVAYFSRGEPTAPQTFYLKVVAINWAWSGPSSARIEVGRMFGQTYANIGANQYWNQKAFIVDEVLYNVVAIKAEDKCIKYITFREKLPKMPIKLYGKHLKVWQPEEILPEMPPFNMPHEIIVDVQTMWTKPYSQQDKIGEKKARPPLVIKYIAEDEEMRFKGELKEIYNETLQPYKEFWMLEWFHTQPQQYTAFVLPRGELYLMTLAWFAPESCITIWDGDPTKPIFTKQGVRVKFWYDPIDNEDIYMPRVGVPTPPPKIDEYYDIPANGGDGDDSIDLDEVVNAILDYLHNEYPFGPGGQFDKGYLIQYIMAYLKQEGYLPP